MIFKEYKKLNLSKISDEILLYWKNQDIFKKNLPNRILDDIIEDISETVDDDRGLSWQRKPKIKEEDRNPKVVDGCPLNF